MAPTRKVKQFTADTLIQALGYAQTWMKENASEDVLIPQLLSGGLTMGTATPWM
jgi:hypothetical protein